MASRWSALFLAALLPLGVSTPLRASGDWWPEEVSKALARSGANQTQLSRALAAVPIDRRKGLAFLIANMPERDLKSLTADFLIDELALAYKARAALPWGKTIPEELFLNDVLPYVNLDETREHWRGPMYDLCLPIVKDCKTPGEAAAKLNAELFGKLKVKYSTERKAPNQSPAESIAQGKASCTGLSILLSDACRSVCIPARLVGTPMWANKRGNHTWVEIWDKDWHFTGACEADPKGLDRGWFTDDASKAVKDSPEHAIFATSFKASTQHFPLVWAIGDRSVPGENVTDRYTVKTAPKTDRVRVDVRVVDAAGKRVAVAVTCTLEGDGKPSATGTSRGETADTNDILPLELLADRNYAIVAGGRERAIRTPKTGDTTVTISIAVAAEDAKSAAAVEALRTSLEKTPASLEALRALPFALVPLTKADAALARAAIVGAHRAIVRRDRAAEFEAKAIKDGTMEMPFDYTIYGKKPVGGRSLYISLHGGGGAPKAVNDQQWNNQKKLYTPEEGIYLAPRAPTDTWNLWHEPHIDRMFARLIENLIVLEGVDPDRVYLLGYSAGGDGVYQLAPRMADRWAAAAMMAGHPNGVSLLSLRNVPFALQVGANDSAYDRNKVGADYGTKLDSLQKADPKGYAHFVKIHEGKGHWMNLEDKAALPWMAKYARNPVPDRVVWKQTGSLHPSSYWLAVPAGKGVADSLVVAERAGQSIGIVAVEKATDLLIRLDDRTVDLDREVKIAVLGAPPTGYRPARTIDVMLRTLGETGDPKLMFEAEVAVPLTR